jgi:hypothetical protein
MVVGMLLTVPDIPMWPLTILSVVIAVVVPLLFFPWSRTTWTAIDLVMTPVRAAELDPAWAPAAAATPRPARPQRPGRPGSRTGTRPVP